MRKARAVTFWLTSGSLLATLGLTELAGHTVLASTSSTSTSSTSTSSSAGVSTRVTSTTAVSTHGRQLLIEEGGVGHDAHLERAHYDHSNNVGANHDNVCCLRQLGGVVKVAPVFERFQALGCGAVVGVTDAEALSAVVAEVRAEVAACDLACSRFRDDSELMSLNDPARVNATAVVSPWLAEALATALCAASETGGLVDPTIGQCLIDLGYDRSFELLGPDQPLVVRATHVPAWERVSVRKWEARVPRACASTWAPRPRHFVPTAPPGEPTLWGAAGCW